MTHAARLAYIKRLSHYSDLLFISITNIPNGLFRNTRRRLRKVTHCFTYMILVFCHSSAVRCKMSSEQFCLKWSDFQGSFSHAFDELWQEKELLDVTLACEDEQIQAHKTVISACSPFFRSVLKKNPHTNPLIYLKGVKYRDLLSVLDFMYQGEVNIQQDRLDSFLEVAEELKVKGLTNNITKPPENANKSINPTRTNKMQQSLPNAIFSNTEENNQISPIFIDVDDDEQILDDISEEICKTHIAHDDKSYADPERQTLQYEGNLVDNNEVSKL